MSIRRFTASLLRPMLLAAALAVMAGLMTAPAEAQFINQQVGGVSIDASGVLSKIQVDQLNDLKRFRQQVFADVPGDLQDQGLRKISLRGLEAAIAELRKQGQPLTDDIRYLGGLQRIQ